MYTLGENYHASKNANATLLKIYIDKQNEKSWTCYMITVCS